jgi:deazaflavin-dependent oxidoreductase (nitroreductase family)
MAAMSAYDRALRALARTAPMRWTLSKVLMPLDMRLRDTRFAPSTLGVGMPLCYLTTIGRTSGEPRTVPLLHVPVDGGGVAVVATNFGREKHPGWALNLRNDPRATMSIGDREVDMVARSASDEEAAEIWARFDGVWPGYERYREIAPRDIHVFVLTPAPTPA